MKGKRLAIFVTTVIVAISAVSFTACGTPQVTAIAAAPGTEVIHLLSGEMVQLDLAFSFDRADISAEQQEEVIAELATTYTSDNEAVCVVDEAGTVTAGNNGGTATVTAAIGENLAATWSVNVAVPVERVSVAASALELFINDEDSATLNATAEPSNATDSAISYTSSEPSVATVDSATGQVKAISNGMAIVTATAGGKSATVSVTVATLPTEITLESAEGWLYVGGSVTLNPVILPEEATQEFTAESDNADVAAAEQGEDGSITVSAVGAGTATINIQAGNVSATYTLTVRARPAPQAPTAPSGGSGGQGTSDGGTNNGSAPSQGDDLSSPYGGPYGWGHIPGVRPSAQNPSIGIGPDGTRYSAQGDVMNVVPPGTERPPMPTEPPMGMPPDSGYWEWDEIGCCWNYWLNPGDGTNGGQAGGM